MAIPDSQQAVMAAFSFGLVFQAATAAFFLYFKGHSLTIFQDHQRLVLVIFLLFVSLWALIDFANFSVPLTRPDICQATVALSTAFDQLARIAIGGFLLCYIGRREKPVVERYIMGASMVMRTGAGIIFTIFARPSFASVCVVQSSSLSASIIVLVFDGTIINILAARLFILGAWRGTQDIRPSTTREHDKAFILCTAGLLVWSGASVPMILGFSTIILLLRTAVPATGLIILISILTIYPSTLVLPRDDEISIPEAQDPFLSFPSRNLGLIEHNGVSPVTNNAHMRSTHHSVATPSHIGLGPTVAQFQTGEKARETRRKIYPEVATIGTTKGHVRSSSSRGMKANGASSGLTQSIIITSDRVSRPTSTSNSRNMAFANLPSAEHSNSQQQNSRFKNKTRRSLFGRSESNSRPKIGRLVISQPTFGTSATPSPGGKTGENVRVKRKKISQGLGGAKLISTTGKSPSDIGSSGNTKSLSTLLRQEPAERGTKPQPSNFIQQPLRSNAMDQQTAMYINSIVSDNLAMLKSVNGRPPTFTKQKPELGEPRTPISPTPSFGSMMHRPRPYRRDSEKCRILFPSEPSLSHSQSKSGSSDILEKQNSQPQPDSQTNLPVSPLPTNALTLRKLLPDDTQILTADEQFTLLFPAPPGVSPLHKQSLLLPSPPLIPSTLFSLIEPSMKQDSQSQRTSRATISIYVQNVHGSEPSIKEDNSLSTESGKRPDLDIMAPTRSTEYRKSTFGVTLEVHGSGDDRMGSWTCPYLPEEQHVDFAVSEQVTEETYIPFRKDKEVSGPPVEASNARYLKEINVGSPPIPLAQAFLPSASLLKNQSSIQDSNRSYIESRSPRPKAGLPWHLRVGDKPPAFSERRRNLRSRAMPPPTPLLLNSNSRRNVTGTARGPESQLADSLGKVVREVQGQLERFSVPGQRYLDSQVCDTFKNDSSDGFGIAAGDRLEVLKDLEKEISIQEVQWMQLQHNFDRDSNSTASNSEILSQKPLSPSPPPPPPKPSFRETSHKIRREPHNKDNISVQAQRDVLPSAMSPQSLFDSSNSIQQQLPAETQTEFKQGPAIHMNNQNLAFSKTRPRSLTLPNNAVSTDADGNDEYAGPGKDKGDKTITSESYGSARSPVTQTSWVPKPLAPGAKADRLWSPAESRTSSHATSPELAAKPLTSTSQQDHFLLTFKIPSPLFKLEPSSPPSLQASGITDTKSSVIHSKSRRPPRMPKQATFLPHIVENPSPLPGRHGALGIFQFSWGEKSDCPVFDPIPLPISDSTSTSPLPNSNLDTRLLLLELEGRIYSPSNFSRHSPDLESDSIEKSDEIRLFLSSTNVPLFQNHPEPYHVWDGEVSDDDSNLDELSQQPDKAASASVLTASLPVTTLSDIPYVSDLESRTDPTHQVSARAATPAAALWAPNYHDRAPHRTSWLTGGKDLTPNTFIDSHRYSKTRREYSFVPNISSASLWKIATKAPPPNQPSEKRPGLWCQEANGTVTVGSRTTRNTNGLLWSSLKTPIPETKGIRVGLFDAGAHRMDFRRSHKAPAASEMIRRTGINSTLLSSLTSQSLWSPESEMLVGHPRISKSSIQSRSRSVSSISPRSSSVSLGGPHLAAPVNCNEPSLWTPMTSFGGQMPASKSEETISSSFNKPRAESEPSGPVPERRVSADTSTRLLWEMKDQTVACTETDNHVTEPRCILESGQQGHLWSIPVPLLTASPRGLLWTAHGASDGDCGSQLTYPMPLAVRKPTAKTCESLSELRSHNLWKPTALPPSGRHWLDISSTSTKATGGSLTETLAPISSVPKAASNGALLWTQRQTTNVGKDGPDGVPNGGLWTAAATGSGKGERKVGSDTQRIFASPSPLASGRKGGRRSLVGGNIRSGMEGNKEGPLSLWRPKWMLPESPRNWLKKQQTSKVEFRY